MCLSYLLAADTKPYSSRLAVLPPSVGPLTDLAATGLNCGRFAPDRLTWEFEPPAAAAVRAGTPLGVSLALRLSIGAALAGSNPGIGGPTRTGRPDFDHFLLLAGAADAMRALPRPALLRALRALGQSGYGPEQLLAGALDKMLDKGAFALADSGGAAARMGAKLVAGGEELLRLRPRSARAHILAGDVLWRCRAPAEAHARVTAGAALARESNQPFTEAMCLAYVPMLVAEGALGPTFTLAQLRAAAARVAAPRRAAGWAFSAMKEALKARILTGEELIAAQAQLHGAEDPIPALPHAFVWAEAEAETTPEEMLRLAAQRAAAAV